MLVVVAVILLTVFLALRILEAEVEVVRIAVEMVLLAAQALLL